MIFNRKNAACARFFPFARPALPARRSGAGGVGL